MTLNVKTGVNTLPLEFLPIPTTREYLEAWAPHWLPFLPDIAKRTKETFPYLLGRVARGEVQIALVWDGQRAHALIGMQYQKRNDDLIAEIIWLTGRGMKQWLHLLPQMEKYLKEHVGCAEIRPICRPGWWRLVKGHGYRITHYMLEKTL